MNRSDGETISNWKDYLNHRVLLIRDRGIADDCLEVKVLEVSPKGRPKFQYPSGNTGWADIGDYLLIEDLRRIAIPSTKQDIQTNEELKKFWERLGFLATRDKLGIVRIVKYPDKQVHTHFPEPTQENLFKYAVPKLEGFYSITFGKIAKTHEWGCEIAVIRDCKRITFTSSDKDPAQALFKALQVHSRIHWV